MEKKLTMPRVLIIISAMITMCAFFLPYISQTGDARAYYLAHDTAKLFDNVEMTASDMADISIFEYAKVYFLAGEETLKSKDAGISYGCLFSSLAIFSLLIMLCAVGKMPILIMLWDALMAGAFWIINWDIAGRGIMPVSTAEWGTAYYIYYPVAAVIAICAIWMFVIKRHNKKIRAELSN